MLKKVTLSLILLILCGSCFALSFDSEDTLFDEKALISVSFSNAFNSNIHLMTKEIDIFEFFPSFEKSVDLYIDGENASVEVNGLFGGDDIGQMEEEILDYTFDTIYDSSTNVTSLKEGIQSICSSYGIDNITVNLDSSLGEDQIPLIFKTEGTSMLPTIKSGQSVLVNKTHDIQVGDLVSAESQEYGGICKRVADIDGDSVFLVSDNKNVTYEYYDDYYIESRGIRTWVNIDDIDGEIIYIFD